MAEDNSKSLQKEQKLVKLYMELTGTSETLARGVFMLVQAEINSMPTPGSVETQN